MNKLIKEFESKNKKYKYVFFDIFDTIVTRNVEPEYVKKIWATNIVKIFKINIEPNELYTLRNKVEYDLCNKAYSDGNDPEFSYIEMIKVMYYELNTKVDCDFKLFYKVCEDTEIIVESNAQIVCDETIEFVKYLKKKNVKLCCVSDMYLSKNMIKKIFSNKDILKYFDDIFMSADCLISKRTGKLYKYVLEKLSIDASKILMIGDNFHSDHQMAIDNGIDSIHIDMENKKEFNIKFLNEVSEQNIFKNIGAIIKKDKREAFTNVVFSLYPFIEKLYFTLLANNAKDVVFFSREGQFLKKLFDEYQKTTYNYKINSHYAIVSRKSTYIASLKELEKEDFASLLDQYSYNSIEGFVKSLNFSDEEFNAVVDSLDKKIDVKKKVQCFKNSNKIKMLRANDKFKMIYETKRKVQKQNITQYFKNLNLNDEKNMNIVDIGWKGSIQTNISNILNSVNVYGYYFGLITNNKIADDRIGLMFTNFPVESENFNLYNENKSLYEILLGADHGSAHEYVKVNKTIKAVMFETAEEKELYKNIIIPIQKEIFDYFIDIKDILQNRIYDEGKIIKMFNQAHYNMLFLPNEDQRVFFNKIYHYENFGVFEFTNFTGKHNYKNKLWELGKYLLRNKVYISDYYWPQLKNYNNNVLLIAKLYAIQRRIEFKKKNLI